MRNWQLALAFYTWYDNARESRYLKNRASQAILLYASESQSHVLRAESR